MSRLMRKPAVSFVKNKVAEQLISAFDFAIYIDSTIPVQCTSLIHNFMPQASTVVAQRADQKPGDRFSNDAAHIICT